MSSGYSSLTSNIAPSLKSESLSPYITNGGAIYRLLLLLFFTASLVRGRAVE
ncbi:hypothetical protein OAM77_00735 [Alphaproteobacteria bacterium]|nr:hypothetical protein [Alphaproteobacteria bacterium]